MSNKGLSPNWSLKLSSEIFRKVKLVTTSAILNSIDLFILLESSQQRRKMQLEASNEKNAKTMSVEASELLDKLPDLSWVQLGLGKL